MKRLEDAVDDLTDAIEALSPMWRYTLLRVKPRTDTSPLNPVQAACRQLIVAVIGDGFGLDEASTAVVDAARAMTPTDRQEYVRAVFQPEIPAMPAALARYWTKLAAVLAAADTAAKELT